MKDREEMTDLFMERYPCPPHRSLATLTVLLRCQDDMGLMAQHMQTTCEG